MLPIIYGVLIYVNTSAACLTPSFYVVHFVILIVTSTLAFPPRLNSLKVTIELENNNWGVRHVLDIFKDFEASESVYFIVYLFMVELFSYVFEMNTFPATRRMILIYSSGFHVHEPRELFYTLYCHWCTHSYKADAGLNNVFKYALMHNATLVRPRRAFRHLYLPGVVGARNCFGMPGWWPRRGDARIEGLDAFLAKYFCPSFAGSSLMDGLFRSLRIMWFRTKRGVANSIRWIPYWNLSSLSRLRADPQTRIS